MEQIDNEIRDKEKFIQEQMKQIKEIHKNYNLQICYKNALEVSMELLKNYDTGHQEEVKK